MPNSIRKERLVRDYMQTTVVTVPLQATLKEAVAAMVEAKTNGLIVVNGDRKVIGILSSWDIIKYIVPDYLEDEQNLAAFEAGDFFEQRTKEVGNDSIKKFMTSRVHTIEATATLMEAAAILSEHRIRQLPVIDDAGTLVGYINRTDVKKAIHQILSVSS